MFGLFALGRVITLDAEQVPRGLALPPTTVSCWCRPSLSGTASPVADLFEAQQAEPAVVRVLRARTREWLAASGVGDDLGDEVLQAVDEALTNAVEHAHGEHVGHVVLQAGARACGGGVAVLVGDDGTWRPPAADPGYRGRGITMIGLLADRATVTTSGDGTTVRMCWALPVPARLPDDRP